MSDREDVTIEVGAIDELDVLAYEGIAQRLKEDALRIEIPPERIERSRQVFIEAIESSGPGQSRRWKRVAALLAATLVLGALGGTAYASSKAEPGSPLWALRAAGWNMKLAVIPESRQTSVLAEQAENASDLAEGAVSRCDSKGAEVARKEAIERVRRAREKIEQRNEGSDSNAAVVLARVEAKLDQLPPPGGPVCDASGNRIPGPAQHTRSGERPEVEAPGKSGQAPGHSSDQATAGSDSGKSSKSGNDSSGKPAGPADKPDSKGGNPDPKGPPEGKGPSKRG